MSNTIVAGGMSALLLGGGAMGFVRKGSKASLIAGLFFGSVFAAAAIGFAGVPSGSKPSAVLVNSALATSLLLGLSMGFRAVKSGFAPIPSAVAAAGLVSAASFFVLNQ